mmetsp:Transcript_4733/g.8476  ORF Transcript_4733/g.8476 Transcript_4733/m.8476 type:complete len:211 (+) Transcript_4733:1474-2106(+)
MISSSELPCFVSSSVALTASSWGSLCSPKDFVDSSLSELLSSTSSSFSTWAVFGSLLLFGPVRLRAFKLFGPVLFGDTFDTRGLEDLGPVTCFLPGESRASSSLLITSCFLLLGPVKWVFRGCSIDSSSTSSFLLSIVLSFCDRAGPVRVRPVPVEVIVARETFSGLALESNSRTLPGFSVAASKSKSLVRRSALSPIFGNPRSSKACFS